MVKVYSRYPNKDYSKKANFYGSTQSRLKTYTADRRVEENNGDIQQAKVYQRLAIERGDMETADRLSKLGTMIINKFGQSVQAQVAPALSTTESPVKFDIRSVLKQALENGTLSQLWDRMKAVPDSKLSHKAQIIKSDIKHNKLMRDILNEKLAPIHEQKFAEQKLIQGRTTLTEPKVIGKLAGPNSYPFISVQDVVIDIIDTITGSKENEPALGELIQQAGGPGEITWDEAFRVATQSPDELRIKEDAKRTKMMMRAIQSESDDFKQLMRNQDSQEIAKLHELFSIEDVPESFREIVGKFKNPKVGKQIELYHTNVKGIKTPALSQNLRKLNVYLIPTKLDKDKIVEFKFGKKMWESGKWKELTPREALSVINKLPKGIKK